MLTESWDRYLVNFPDEAKDIYFAEAYVRAQASADDIPLCFVYNEGANYFLCTFLKRRVAWLPDDRYDVETPYGYGGPITNSRDPDFILRAAACMAEELQEARVIAAFLRFHPLLENQELLSGRSCFEVMPDRETVVMNLSLSEEEIWGEHIHGKHRNAISQARRAGLTFHVDRDGVYLDDFRSLYEATMNRLAADDFYFFSREYFTETMRLSPRAFLGVVLKDKRCIAAAFFLNGGIFGHYHLSASDLAAQVWRPNNFMIYEAALALKGEGARWFHLGGAADSVNSQSLFQFKSRFSKVRKRFFIGKAVLDQESYDAACAKWLVKYPEKQDRYGHFLLKYRF